ncbi:hypothetical protein WR25_06052 [Diploscapter pachys]|uniref:Ataxin-10 n=1 Tax=Diploscapter pachys TaxID=2018661 RepID=A0A2A2J2V5_9BILA|nr:hypothetical protein WR25_06052 [Diploscapter pachys]
MDAEASTSDAELIRRVYDVSDDVKNSQDLSNDVLARALKFVGSNPESESAIDQSNNPSAAFLRLLEIPLESHFDEQPISTHFDLKRSRLALRLLVNSANRNQKFKNSLPNSALRNFRALLRISELQNEVFILLASTAEIVHKVFALNPEYPCLIGELAVIFESLTDDSQRSWLSAFFSTIFEKDYGFLATAFGELESAEFTALLNCLEVLLDYSEHGTVIKIHPNNVQFCVDLLERILFELHSESASSQLENIQLLLQILANASVQKTEFNQQLCKTSAALELAIKIAEAALDAEIVLETEERQRNPSILSPDRPIRPINPRKAVVLENPQLSLLSSTFVLTNSSEEGRERKATIKQAAVICIGNLCCECRQNQLVASKCGAMLAVLQCTRRLPSDKPFITKWSITALRHMTKDCPENQQFILEIDDKPSGIIDREKLLKELGMDFNFGNIDTTMYGNVEADEELLAELMALEEEEKGGKASSSSGNKARAQAAASANVLADARRVAMADPTAEVAEVDDEQLEGDDELLAELSNLVGGDGHSHRSAPPPQKAPAAPPIPPRSTSSSSANQAGGVDQNKINELKNLQNVYRELVKVSKSAGEDAKSRRQQRAVDKITELIGKLEKGLTIDEGEIPPAPPSLPNKPAVPAPATHPAEPSIRSAAAPSNLPPVPSRSSSTASASSSTVPSSSSSAAIVGGDPKAEIRAVLIRRRNAYVANGKAAIKAEDKAAAKGFVDCAKQFDEAIAALDQVSVDEIDLNEIPPTPPPYRKKEEPKKASNFVEGLEQRKVRYMEQADRAKQSGDDRKSRMYIRMVGQYNDAIKMAKAGKPVNVNELPSLPDMPPLPPQQGQPPQPQMGTAIKKNQAAMQPQPSAGKHAASTSGDLEFLIQRQNEFKQAALICKQRGDIERAKKYLTDAKGFDPMIQAARAGHPVSIKQTPIPPQLQTSSTALQPKIVTSTKTGTVAPEAGNRSDVLSLLEKTLIEQIQTAEQSRMRFTRLGDVGKVKLFEGWAKTAKQDLLLVREVAKRRDIAVPKFHYEMRQAPSSHINPDLAEDALELSILSCRDVPLPSGYEMHHASIFAKYIFPYPNDNPQGGKTKTISGNTSPEFNETIMLNIGSGKTRGTKVLRVLKRSPLKIEVYQKGGLLRSDKLLGVCEWKLDKLEHDAEMEESLPLKEGRKAIGGLCTMRIRIREPLGDAKQQLQHVKWLVLDN